MFIALPVIALPIALPAIAYLAVGFACAIWTYRSWARYYPVEMIAFTLLWPVVLGWAALDRGRMTDDPL